MLDFLKSLHPVQRKVNLEYGSTVSQQFDEKFARLVVKHCTYVELQNFTATVLSQKFRQFNVLLKNFTINWFDGKQICVAVIFSFFHTVIG